MAKKKVTAVIKLQCPAGKATPAPPVGPALGPHGVSAPQFVQQFNDRTKSMEPGLVVPVVITVYSDLIRKACNIQKGSSNSITQKVATLSKAKLEEIAKMKMPDVTANDLEAAKKIIAGTARSMGVEVER